ncbi:hypothetical protein OFY73_004565 [Salmonella enterica]|nr:hypothetical protein [Salmonella enterica subsp. enterica serovar Edinburgh]EBH8904572.1 hypothetical protein [Salmonella enterica subsp. enterica serovar 6,7:b:-]EBH8909570.1 hypothetical protein [Salmonella enterica subsp. enterica serovar Santiago]EHG2695488.1 hypothetical protein [Salmonella enterica]EBH8946269.1 hypothetical protein [Salmonella enterica subsp. enterica serovar 6,7:b:-]
MNYYGKFYKSKLAPILAQLNYSLVRWARRKYKRLGSASQATTWLKRMVAQLPRFFTLDDYSYRNDWTIGAG